jgi:cyclopropane fatty-acyl-phospholipid synthase-like methyltransferase
MEDIAATTAFLPRIFLDVVLPNLPSLEARLQGTFRLLDVGCGGGWALLQFAERFPDARCVGLDIEPYSVEMARNLLAQRGLAERCEARLAGIDQLGEEGAYDVATSFLVVHEIQPELKPGAFKAIARALKPGGSFVVFDEVYPENDTDLRSMPKRFAALAQWFELTWGNVVNTRTELVALCESAGLLISEETSFSRFHILVATKPA